MDITKTEHSIVAIIQARMDSSRTLGKTMTMVGNHPLLYYSVNRTQQSDYISSVIVATTTKKKDDCIIQWCEEEEILSFRGSENDVLDRYYQTARKYVPDYVVRITSDCPFADPEIIDLVIGKTIDSGVDYGSNRIHLRTWPHGLDIEVVKYRALEKAWKEAVESDEREHVTPYIRNHAELFSQVEVPLDSDLSDYRLTVDYPEDLELVRVLIEDFHADEMDWKEIIRLIDTFPWLREINFDRIDVGL